MCINLNIPDSSVDANDVQTYQKAETQHAQFIKTIILRRKPCHEEVEQIDMYITTHHPRSQEIAFPNETNALVLEK